MNIVRKIKISKLTNKKLTRYEKKLIKFFDFVFQKYIPYRFKSILYIMNIGGGCDFEYDKKNKILYVGEDQTWNSLINNDLMSYEHLFDYLKYRMQKEYSIQIEKVVYKHMNWSKIETAFKKSKEYLKLFEGLPKLTYLDFIEKKES